jgi:integrase
LAAAATDRLSALYVVTAALDLRQGEALGLRWTDLALEAGYLQVVQQLQRVEKKLVLVPTKTNRSRRRLKLPAFVTEALRSHMVRQKEERLAAGPDWLDSGLAFTTPIGTPLDGGNVFRAFQRRLLTADVRKISFHTLRHGCASMLIAMGVHPQRWSPQCWGTRRSL